MFILTGACVVLANQAIRRDYLKDEAIEAIVNEPEPLPIVGALEP